MLRKVFVSVGMRVFGALAPIVLSYFIVSVYKTDQSAQALNFLVLVAFIKILLSRGLPSASLRFFSSDSSHIGRYFWPAFLKLNINSFQFWIFAFVLIFLLTDYNVFGAMLTVLSGHIGANLLFGRFAAVAGKRVALSIVSEPLGLSLICMSLLVIFTYFGMNPRFEILYLASAILVAIPVFYVLKPCQFNYRDNLSNNDFGKSAWKFYQINLLSYLVNWGSVLAAGYFLSGQHLQDLNISVRLSSSVTLVLVSLNAIFAPDLARSFKIKDRNQVIRLSGTFQLWSQISTLVFCGVLLAGSSELLHLSKGGDYSQYVLDPLQVVVIGQLISGLSGPCFGILNMSGNEHVQLHAIAAGVVMAVLALLILGFHSIYDFAIATSVGVVTQNLFGVYKVHKILGINLLLIVFSKEYRGLKE